MERERDLQGKGPSLFSMADFFFSIETLPNGSDRLRKGKLRPRASLSFDTRVPPGGDSNIKKVDDRREF